MRSVPGHQGPGDRRELQLRDGEEDPAVQAAARARPTARAGCSRRTSTASRSSGSASSASSARTCVTSSATTRSRASRARASSSTSRGSTCTRSTRSTGASSSRTSSRVGLCNITKCCTEVCPESIHITDNGIIPLKERVADDFYDPVRWLLRKVSGGPNEAEGAAAGGERSAREDRGGDAHGQAEGRRVTTARKGRGDELHAEAAPAREPRAGHREGGALPRSQPARGGREHLPRRARRRPAEPASAGRSSGSRSPTGSRPARSGCSRRPSRPSSASATSTSASTTWASRGSAPPRRTSSATRPTAPSPAFEHALRLFEKAEHLRPDSPDPVLRWNRCVRLLSNHPSLKAAIHAPREDEIQLGD